MRGRLLTVLLGLVLGVTCLSGCAVAGAVLGVDAQSLDTSGFTEDEADYLIDLFDGGVITGEESRTSLRSLVDVGNAVCLLPPSGENDAEFLAKAVEAGGTFSGADALLRAARAHLC
ncbi:exported protein of unknown function [Modestobacter italicus]|uniref:DUF732 domain-containing protein n=1 Tax=Modestobacter italicus (strain DSM 44449 / CECT 9708 / BC 501) TaxID=2732864 RepID=I4ES00_MODI5|nr:hypothetical protein [Modestobacter marinus]CCH86163.1 exported protein of unknown function [Modestobacter marinus]